jgi:hypothetical protein
MLGLGMDAIAKKSVFNPLLNKTTTRFYEFQEIICNQFNGVLSDNPSDREVKNKFVDPLFEIADAYLLTENYVSAAKDLDIKTKCQVFSYCSACDLDKKDKEKLVDRISQKLSSDPKTQKVYNALNTAVAQVSGGIKLTGNPNYKPPQSLHALTKNLISADVSTPEIQSKYDASYFQLMFFSTILITKHAEKGALSMEDLNSRIAPFLAQGKPTISSELDKCSPFQKTPPKKSKKEGVINSLDSKPASAKPQKKGLLDDSFKIIEEDKTLKKYFKFGS